MLAECRWFFFMARMFRSCPRRLYRSCKLRILGFQRSDLGGRNLAEVGDDGGINCVGLGQVVHGFGEVVYLAGIYDNGGKPLGQQGTDGCYLVRTGRFEVGALGSARPNLGNESCDTRRGVGKALPNRGKANVAFEKILIDIDVNDDALHKSWPLMDCGTSNETENFFCSNW